MTELIRSSSEDIQNENRENYIPLDQVDRSQWELIHPEDARQKLNYSSRTAYNYIADNKVKYTIKGDARYVLKSKVQPASEISSEGIGKNSEEIQKNVRRNSENSEILQSVVSEVRQSYRDVLSAKDQIIENLQAQLADKDTVIDRLVADKSIVNNQLQATNTAILALKEARKEPQSEEVEQLRAQIAELQKRKPFWKLW